MDRSLVSRFLSLCFFVITTSCFSQKNSKDSIAYYFQQKEYVKAQKLATEYLSVNPYDNEMVYLNAQIPII